MVTFAKLALKNIQIPYTSNVIERLMGEISKRCKHKWMHWSTEGLENMLQIILVRYTNPQFYKQFWKTYIHPSQYQPTLTTPT
jgi:transposase-like protein